MNDDRLKEIQRLSVLIFENWRQNNNQDERDELLAQYEKIKEKGMVDFIKKLPSTVAKEKAEEEE